MVKALVFDTFGTLFDWRTSLIAFFEKLGADRGITADWPEFVDEWRGAYVPSMEKVRRGELPWMNLDALHRRSFDELAERFALGTLSNDERERCTHAWHELDPWSDVRTGMQRLHVRHILGTLSNGSVALLIDLARRAELPFDMIFSAELFRHYKPDPETYRGAADLLQLPPADVMLVAAHNTDLRAAAACGLRTAFVARPTEYGPRQTKDLTAEERFDVVARDLNELADRLEAAS
jgi:2-haloacid dehalogenase